MRHNSCYFTSTIGSHAHSTPPWKSAAEITPRAAYLSWFNHNPTRYRALYALFGRWRIVDNFFFLIVVIFSTLIDPISRFIRSDVIYFVITRLPINSIINVESIRGDRASHVQHTFLTRSHFRTFLSLFSCVRSIKIIGDLLYYYFFYVLQLLLDFNQLCFSNGTTYMVVFCLSDRQFTSELTS